MQGSELFSRDLNHQHQNNTKEGIHEQLHIIHGRKGIYNCRIPSVSTVLGPVVEDVVLLALRAAILQKHNIKCNVNLFYCCKTRDQRD